MNPFIIVAVFAGTSVVLLGVGAISSYGGNTIGQRLESFTSTGKVDLESVQQPAKQRASPLGDKLNNAVTRRGFASGIATSLARADLKITVTEYMALAVICAIGGMIAGLILFGGFLPLVAVAALIGAFAPRIYVWWRKRSRLIAFNNQLGDTLSLWVNSLRSGYSVLQAMEAISREMPAPVSTEFNRVVQEVRLGLTVEIALANLLRRVPSDDMDLIVTAVNVQREVGGNLAEILDVISFTIRERVRIQGEIRALTAQAMGSGYIITALPIVLALFLFAINHDYMIQLFTDICGLIAVGVSGAMVFIGFLIINKIVRIEV